MLPIDPKAPYNSPQHPANWRKPQFLAPEAVAPPAAADPVRPEPPKPAAEKPPTRKAGKRVTQRAKPDLAAALAALDAQ